MKVCKICLKEGTDIFLPRILACGHIYCLTCLVQFYFKCKGRCCICDQAICIMDAKRLIVDQKIFEKNEQSEFTLTSKIFKDRPLYFSFDWAHLKGSHIAICPLYRKAL